MRITIAMTALVAFIPHSLALVIERRQNGVGAYVWNNCPFPICFYADQADGQQGTGIQTIQPYSPYYETYKGPGRAIKLWKTNQAPPGQSSASLLVWGYTKDDNTPFVWSVLVRWIK